MSGRHLTIPARVSRPGDATFVEALVDGRPPLDGALKIASFEGTEFIDQWLNLAGSETGSLPALVPFRDWTEPPTGTLDATGAPKWTTGIDRGTPYNTVSTQGTVGASLDPDGVPSDDVDWLRKLYLPAHDRYNIVSAELVCRQPTLPYVTRSRVKETGVIIRRIAIDDAGDISHQDWVDRGDGQGSWIDLSGFGLHAESHPATGATLDPKSLPKNDILRVAMGLPSDAKLSVHSKPGAIVARDKDVDPRTIAWAVLPLVSSDREAYVDPGIDTLAEFADDLIADLESDFEGTAQELHESMIGPWIDLVNPLIPADPGPSVPPFSATFAVTLFRTNLWNLSGGNLGGYSAWYNGAMAVTESSYPWAQRPFVRPAIEHLIATRWGTLKTSLQNRTALSATSTRELRTWSAIIARRVRACRIELIQDIYGVLDDTFGGGIDTLDEVDNQTSASTLAAEIDNWIFAEENRALTPRPWAPMTFAEHSRAVHDGARELERVFERIRERLSPAGAAYREALNNLQPSNASFDISGFDLPAAFLDWTGELEAGLLIWPTVHLTDGDLTSFVGPAGTIRTQAASAAVTDLSVIETNAPKQLRPRFDSDHLYVAQLFSRVAGTHPCDPWEVVWSEPTEPFLIAPHTDLLGTQPVSFEAPNIPRLLNDIPKLARAGASPFAHILTPDGSAFLTGEEPGDTKRSWELAMICSFGIPVFTIIAMILFQLIFSIMIMIPGFVWMLLLKFCLPIPRRTS